MIDNDLSKPHIVYLCEACGRFATEVIFDFEETEPLIDGKWRMYKPISKHHFCQEHTRKPIKKPFFKNEQEEREWRKKRQKEIEQLLMPTEIQK